MSEHLSVALITPWMQKGGIAVYAERLTDKLRERGIDVDPVQIQASDSSNPLAFGNLVSDIPQETDVIHVQFEAGLFGRLGMSGIGAPWFFQRLAKESRPTVTTLHEVHGQHNHRGFLGDRLLRLRDTVIERKALRASDAVIVPTREAVDVLNARHSPDTRIERMPHPVETEADPIATKEAKRILDVKGKIVLTFGWVEPKKHYEDVIRLLPEFSELIYIIAGEPREEQGSEHLANMVRLAEDLGVSDRVRTEGYVADDRISELFSATDAVVLPYNRVSQSGVINDALSFRRPVIASDLGYFEELADEYGCLLTYGSREELASHLQRVLYDAEAKERLTNAAEEYVMENSWSSFATRTARLYRELAQT